MIIVTVMNVILVKEFMINKKKMNMSKLGKSSDSIMLVGQLLLVTITNMICWFPANIIYITAMFVDRFSVRILLWTVVGIMPINSVVNPAIFLFFCLRKHLKRKTA